MSKQTGLLSLGTEDRLPGESPGLARETSLGWDEPLRLWGRSLLQQSLTNAYEAGATA